MRMAESTPNTPTTMEASSAPEASKSEQILRKVLMALATISTLLLIALATNYMIKNLVHHHIRQSIAVVDIEQAIDLRRTGYLQIIRNPAATQEQLDAANAYIKQSSSIINAALADMASQCACLLMVKPAVLSHQEAGVRDLTADLLERLSSEKFSAQEKP
jgi:hypothetical protein